MLCSLKTFPDAHRPATRSRHSDVIRNCAFRFGRPRENRLGLSKVAHCALCIPRAEDLAGEVRPQSTVSLEGVLIVSEFFEKPSGSFQVLDRPSRSDAEEFLGQL